MQHNIIIFEKKGNGYATGHMDQKKALGNGGYLVPIILIKMIYGLLQTKCFIRQLMLRNLEVEHFLH